MPIVNCSGRLRYDMLTPSRIFDFPYRTVQREMSLLGT
jgi:hypothetical protein